MNKIYPIIMAGGTGSRLWPLSREGYPKQFIRLYCQDSMLQATVKRLDGLANTNPPQLICNEEHRFLAAEQLREIGQLANNILLEPFGRNTAPTIALAALQIVQQDPQALLLVLPADHIIRDEKAFQQAVQFAAECAAQGKLATFGIVAKYPQTGYGYIKTGAAINQHAFVVEQFVEKPDYATAERYVKSGQYLWNSGMFMFQAQRYLQELQQFRPDIYRHCEQALTNAKQDLDFTRIDAESFQDCPSESIDYAVMENTKDAVVVPMDAGWSDVGCWSSLWDISDKDSEQNVIKGDVIALSSNNNYIRAEHKLVAAVGVDDLVIVETKDAILVINKACAQEVKGIIDKLKLAGRQECSKHREVYRPWGKYDLLDQGERYQVNYTRVKPGEKIALQLHHHRSEHWVVVSGTAKVILGDEVKMVTENQSIYIPIGVKHSVENIGKIDLEMIEIQSGSYLQEDDIIRFEDNYGR